MDMIVGLGLGLGLGVMIYFLFTACGAFLLSLIAKLLADSFLTGHPPILVRNVGLHFSENPGIAFGIRLPGAVQSILIACAMVFVLFLALRSGRRPFTQVSYGLIVGGALGNLIDRLNDGYVTDFIRVGLFPIFNIADSCITVGVAFLLAECLELFPYRKTGS